MYTRGSLEVNFTIVVYSLQVPQSTFLSIIAYVVFLGYGGSAALFPVSDKCVGRRKYSRSGKNATFAEELGGHLPSTAFDVVCHS